MNDIVFYLGSFLFLILVELSYFRLAASFGIIDKPNNRSSHTQPTIRGGGIVIAVAIYYWFFAEKFQFPLFVLGLLLISSVSFIDDIKTLGSRTRFIFHFIAIVMLVIETKLDFHPALWFLPIILLIIGTINAWNFMDGINGITGLYSLITFATLWFINHFIFLFTSDSLLLFSLMALLVFNFFNFRKKARCFAGDVGSISIAFIICFIMLQLIMITDNFLYLTFFLIYGLDAGSTMIFRLIRKENIFEAHRSHFYQFLANERKWSHLTVSSIYGITQLVVNICTLVFIDHIPPSESFMFLLGIVFLSSILFVVLRINVEGTVRLLRPSLLKR